MAALLLGQTPEDVQKWLKDVDSARSAFGEAKLRARASQFEDGRQLGTADFDIYVKGRERALIVFRGGKNDGRKALTVGPKMWLIVPGAEHPVPITQNQRIMGGASFADVASIRFAEDFEPALRPGTDKVGDRVCRVIDLTAKAPTAIYPRATLWLDAEGERLPAKARLLLHVGSAGARGHVHQVPHRRRPSRRRRDGDPGTVRPADEDDHAARVPRDPAREDRRQHLHAGGREGDVVTAARSPRTTGRGGAGAAPARTSRGRRRAGPRAGRGERAPPARRPTSRGRGRARDRPASPPRRSR